MSLNDRIGLGTVQFGLKYGINNTSGQVDEDTAQKIVQTYCKAVQIPVYDTASAYGNSEMKLGEIFAKNGMKTEDRIISKFPAQVNNAEALHTSFQRSVKLLQVQKLYAYLAHDAATVIEQPKIYEELLKIKDEGLIQKVGISAYYPAQVQWFLDRKIPLDLIQIPYNLFDTRFEEFFPLYKKAGIEIHTRSAFLQGLFYRHPDGLPAHFDMVKEKIIYIQQLAATGEIPLNKLLLLFCLHQPLIDRVIIGVDSHQQMQHNLITEEDIYHYEKIRGEIKKDVISENILLPFKWPQA